jgi:hypothetical protein
MPTPPQRPPNRPGTPPAGGAARPGAQRPPLAGTPLHPRSPAAIRAQAAAAAQATRAVEDELDGRFDRLDRRIEQLKVEYYRFFAGDAEKPPQALRDDIDAEMRRLRSLNMRRSVDGFRLSGLEAKLNSYGEMFARRLRAQEEGKVVRHPSAAPTGPVHDVDSGIVVSPRFEGDAVEALFQGLVRRNSGGSTMDLDTFRGYLQKQMAQIRDKTGCDAVQFRVVNEDGKVKLKAKPVGGRAGGTT